jgi:hypothetical protein
MPFHAVAHAITSVQRAVLRPHALSCALIVVLAAQRAACAGESAFPYPADASRAGVPGRLVDARPVVIPLAHDVAQASANGARTLAVSNCNDSGTGSLRAAVGAASSGDTIDLTQLACSTITLSSGGIRVDVDDLAVLGPGATQLRIDAGGAGRAIYHTGGGTLSLTGLSLAHGVYTGGPYLANGGGCVYSTGSLDLEHVTVSDCSVREIAGAGTGGAGPGCLFAQDNVRLVDSTISGCAADAVDSGSVALGGIAAFGGAYLLRSTVSGCRASSEAGPAYAGGVFAGGEGLALKYSTIDGNSADGVPGIAGGIYTVSDNVLVLDSTISANQAQMGGGLWLKNYSYTSGVAIRNSTISGNTGSLAIGGVFSRGAIEISNSTIAFNDSDGLYAAGLFIGADSTLQGTIIANNHADSLLRDLGGSPELTVSGSRNLIGASVIDIPADTLDDDPLLSPLADNGGLTHTHALAAASPAIDAGNNTVPLDHDQRGTGYPRVVGASADIGAYESSDRIFANGFD